MIKSFVNNVMRFQNIQNFRFSNLVIGELTNNELKKSFYKIFSAVNKFQEETHLLIMGDNVQNSLENIKKSISNKYVQKIITVENPLLKNITAEGIEQVVKQLIQKNNYTQIISDSSSAGKDSLPRIAACFNSQPITEIIEIISKDIFKRPIYAGNAISTVKSSDKIKFLSFRSTAFEQIPIENVQLIQIIEKFDAKLENFKVKFIKDELVKSDRPELNAARIVISGGRGMKNGENFKLLEQLADVIGESAIGASRAAVDAGYVSNDKQIGQTGKVVAPELYIAVGISGAIQHVAGMKDSKVIVSINKDAEAPIFEISTYGLVGDLFKLVPELTEKLKQQK